MNPSTEAKASALTDLHTINLGYSGFSSDQERWAFLGSLKTYLSESSSPSGQIGFTDNVTGTVITSTTVPTKIVGTTSAGILSGFSHTDGRLTLISPAARVRITITASVSDGNNNAISMFVAKNGTPVQASKCTHTVDTATHFSPITSQALLDLVAGDFIEGFIINATTTSTITVANLSIIAH